MDALGKEIIEMEKAALDRWGRGDPDGFLEICAPDVVYFDPYKEERVDGYHALAAFYESIRGQVYFDHFELIKPLVQSSGSLAILSFNYVSYSGDQQSRWNCTEVYKRTKEKKWRIIQSHWSYTNVFKYQKG
jgi:ketosteroid isomerase-like protein